VLRASHKLGREERQRTVLRSKTRGRESPMLENPTAIFNAANQGGSDLILPGANAFVPDVPRGTSGAL
jgi:hypothetical protein